MSILTDIDQFNDEVDDDIDTIIVTKKLDIYSLVIYQVNLIQSFCDHFKKLKESRFYENFPQDRKVLVIDIMKNLESWVNTTENEYLSKIKYSFNKGELELTDDILTILDYMNDYTDELTDYLEFLINNTNNDSLIDMFYDLRMFCNIFARVYFNFEDFTNKFNDLKNGGN